MTAPTIPSPTRVLVTGGAGYVGSHAAKALRAAGFEPVTLDDLSMGHEWAVKYGPFHRGSIADAALVGRLIEDERIDAVMHFAASAYVRESLTVPEKYFRNNVAGTIAFLEACLASKRVRAFILSSTCAVYGIPDTTPIQEGARTAPINPYGDSKLFIEKMLEWYGKIHGLRWAALRYFNAAGADPDGELGEAHDPETHIIPLLIAAAQGGPPVTLFGLDHDTPDGTAIRDYIHVTDLAQAHVRCLQYLLDGGAPRAFNLGTGRGVSIRELIRAVERAVGKVTIVEAPRSPGDPPSLVADPGAAARVLAWSAQHSELELIVQTAARWHASRARGR
jgi:UDP-arabinose 4-epimerase